MKIVVAAIEGFAHVIAGSLLLLGHDVHLVVPYEPGHYPYYQVPDLYDFCRASGIALDVCPERHLAEETLARHAGSLIVATWPWMLPERVYTNRPLAVNCHPGLVPGRNPWRAALDRGDSYTGVIIHDLGPELDKGRIRWARTCRIESNDTESTLRAQTAGLAVYGLSQILHDMTEGR